MKILMITPYLASVYGGIASVVTELVKALNNQQISVDLITTNANDVGYLDVPLNTWIEHSNYRVRYFYSWHRNDFILSPELSRWLWLHATDYDLLHTHTLFSPLVALVHKICQLKQIPYIMTPHGMLEPWALAYKAWKKRVYYRLFEQKALQQALAIQALTAVEVEQLHLLGFNKCVQIPNGIHRCQFEQLPPTRVFYDIFPHLKGKSLVLFLGRIDPKKGLDLLAKAFARVAVAYPNAHLVIAGPDSINFLPTAQGYFEQAGCAQQVSFTGMLKSNLKFSALAAAQFYVAPSYSEGFSMSILEGMASALPCIFTTGCNFSEAYKAGVAYEVAIDADAIATALLNCFQYPARAVEMGQRAQQFVFEHYTWDSIAQQLGKAYASILNKPLDSVDLSPSFVSTNSLTKP